jgi:tetratricopeptide (TPR) repeat protein
LNFNNFNWANDWAGQAMNTSTAASPHVSLNFMTDWYRRKSWTKTDEEEFFAKLSRARKDGRAQYLKIQAIELVETKDPKLLEAAELLIQKLFADYPDDKLERSSSLETLGDIYKHKQQFDKAIEFYKQAVEFEKTYPNVQTQSYLEYSELVVKLKKQDQYHFAEQIVLKRVKSSMFLVEKYKAFSILSIISNFKGDNEKAKEYAALADKNASAETSGLRHHKYLGVVTERDSLLDKLVNRK